MNTRQDVAPVAEIGVKPGLQVFQHIPPLQREKTPIEFVEVIQEFWENMKRFSLMKDSMYNVFHH